MPAPHTCVMMSWCQALLHGILSSGPELAGGAGCRAVAAGQAPAWASGWAWPGALCGCLPPPPHTTLGREINVDVDRQAFEDSATSWHVLGCLCSAMRQDSPPCCTLREAASVDKFDPQLRESCQGRADCELSVLWCGGELHQPCCQVHQRV